MHLHERIESLEKAIVNHYIDRGEKRLGWTVLQDLKQMVDYIASDDQDWNVVYFEKLSSKADDLRIPTSVR